MKAECVRRFLDLKEGIVREGGEQFDVTAERLAEINSTRYGLLAKKVMAKRKPRQKKEG